MATLTNGAAATTAALLERAGLDPLVDRVISIDEVQTWKPAPAPYRHAAEVIVSNASASASWRSTAGMSTAPAAPA